MKIDKGLTRDTNELDHPNGFIRFGKNGVYDTLFSYQNEPGFLPSSSAIPHTPMGIIELDEGAVIFSTDEVNSVIGIYNDETDTYTKIIDRTDLGFTTLKPISGEFERNYKGEIVIVFSDGIDGSFPKYVNLSHPPETLDQFRLFPLISLPIIESIIINDTGGSLKTGQYFFGLQYKNTDGTETNITPLSAGTGITDDNASVGGNMYDGAPANSSSSKSVSITVSNVDRNFDKLVLVIVSQINGVISSKKLDTISTSNDTVTFNYTGAETVEEVTNEEVFIPRASFSTIKSFTQIHGKLYVAGLTVESPINYQRYANSIKVNYVTRQMYVKDLDYTDIDPNVIDLRTTDLASHKVGAPRSFMPGEVYAIYIRWIKNDGTKSEAFHIPGKPPSSIEKMNNTYDIGIDDAEFFRITSTSAPILEGKGDKGHMGAWENKNEVYPDTIDYLSIDEVIDLRGQPVRHHRMPSVYNLYRDHYLTSSGFGTNTMAWLGIELSNVQIPAEIAATCQGYEILYAKRNVNNSTVITTDLMLFAGKETTGEEPGTRTSTTAGNWNLQMFHPNDEQDPKIYVDREHLRLHSFDLLLDNLQVSPTYIERELDLTVSNLNGVWTKEIMSGGLISATGEDKGQKSRTVIDYVDSIHSVSNRLTSKSILAVDNFRYIPSNLNTGDIVNTAAESFISLDIVEPTKAWAIPFNTPELMLFSSGGNNPANHNFFDAPDLGNRPEEQTSLITLYQYKEDIYNSFMSQELVSTGVVHTIDKETSSIVGGDIFIGEYSFITMAPKEEGGEALGVDGVRVVRRFSGYFNNNVNFRYQDVADPLSAYYPKTDPDILTEMLMSTENPNHLLYNKDYTKLNDFIESSISNPEIEFIGRFPYTVARSKIATREQNGEISWRTFLTNEYYESVKNKGEIENIQRIKDRLIIHHKYSMFITRDKTKLSGDILDITLGTGDIFEMDPEELVDDNKGYAGLQNSWAAILCRFGYIFIDALEGKVFMYNETLTDLTSTMRKYLRDAFTTDNNPFISNGISLAYDKKFERLVIGVKNNSINNSKYKGQFINTPEFIDSLSVGDIVLMDGKYKEFKGL